MAELASRGGAVTAGFDLKRVRHAFDRAAPGYDQVAGLQQEMAGRLLDRLEYIRITPRRVLDVGCGTGWMTGRLLQRYSRARVMGVDFAPGMLRQARLRGSWWRPLQGICATAERLPLADRSIDLLVSNAMLQWCVDPVPVFAEWMRVLRPGGLLLFTTFGTGTLRELAQAWAQVDDHPHVSQFVDMHDLGDALLTTGWQDPVMDVDRFELNYPQVTDLMRELKSLGAGNALSNRHRGLTGKGRLQALRDAYDAYRGPAGLPASYEVVYGHAWAPTQLRVGNLTQVALEGLGGRFAR
jgi:malonyl-CoA O-methyltransferase